jgi:hypothetical protein
MLVKVSNMMRRSPPQLVDKLIAYDPTIACGDQIIFRRDGGHEDAKEIAKATATAAMVPVLDHQEQCPAK